MARNNRRGHRNRPTEEYNSADLKARKRLRGFANELRRERTHAECMLWTELRSNKLGVRFRQQHPVGRYIPDFVCLTPKLIVEIDGGIHDDPLEALRDADRTEQLEALGFTVVRFRNEQVFEDVDAVTAAIRGKLADLSAAGATPAGAPVT